MSTRHRNHMSKEVGYDVPGGAHKANNEYTIDKEEHLFNTSALSKVGSE